MRRLLVQRWLMLLTGLFIVGLCELLLHRYVALTGAVAALHRFGEIVEILLSFVVNAATRLLGLPVLLVSSIEIFHHLSGEGEVGVNGRAHRGHAPHVSHVTSRGGLCRYLSEKPHLAIAVFVCLAICWYCVIFPPSFRTACSAVLTPLGIIFSGFFVSKVQMSDDAEMPWRFFMLSIGCLYLSGSKSFLALLTFDTLVVVSHGIKRLKHIYILHETRRDFCQRVQTALDMDGFHPAFIEDGFASLVHHSLRAPLARQLSFVFQKALSFGTQQRLLGQKYERLMSSLHSMEGNVKEMHWFEIDRADLLSSTFRAIQQAPREDLLATHLQVSFRGEPAEDAGGPLRDWFDGIGRALVVDATEAAGVDSPRPIPLLMLHPEDSTLLLRPSGRWDDIFALGRLIALAVRHAVHLPLPFGTLSWKLLLGRPIEAADVQSADPLFFKNRVAAVLRPGGVEGMAAILGEPLFFLSAPGPLCSEEVELVPGGRELPVTEENKLEYARKLCEFHICGQAQREWQLLRQGFLDLLPLDSTCGQKDLSAHDLELLVAGLPTIDVDDWMINSNVDGPLANREQGKQVQDWFWEVLHRFGDERRAKLLQFTTGSSRVPCEGFVGLQPPFCLYLSAGPVEHLPTASTCNNQLNLVAYTSRSMLIDKMRAICSAEASVGFGFI